MSIFDSGNNGSFSVASDLRKAMVAGQITGRDTADQSLGIEPTKFEDLTENVKSLEVRKKDIVLKSKIASIPAYDTIAQWIQEESYGDTDSGFISEAEDVTFSDSVYNRRAEIHKYVAFAGEASLQASAVKTVLGNVNAKRTQNLLMQMLIKLNKTLWHGDARVNPKEFNGMLAQHGKIGSDPSDYYNTLDSYYNSTVVYDLRGKPLDYDALEDAGNILLDNNADIDMVVGSPTIISDLSKDFQRRVRPVPGMSTATNGYIIPSAVDTSFGMVDLLKDKFTKRGGDVSSGTAITLATAASTSSKAPAAPVPDGVAPTALAGAGTAPKFVAGGVHTDVLGDVYYAVRAINTYGWSAPVLLDSTATTLTATQGVDLKFAAAGGGTAATGFMIYRTKKTDSLDPSGASVPFYPLFKISLADLAAGYDGAAAGLVRDKNRILPDTQDAMTGSLGIDVMGYHELIPISKYDIARTTSLTDKYAVVSVSTPVLYAPKKLVKFINVGPFIEA